MDEHYICKCCGGVSDEPKNCETSGCDCNGQPLGKCDCGDKESHSKKDDDMKGDMQSE